MDKNKTKSQLIKELQELRQRIAHHNKLETERKKAEEELQENEEKYRSIFESLYDVYYRTDKEGRITIISPSVRSQAGYDPKEVIGHPITDFYLNPSDREVFSQKLKESGSVNDYELRLLKKDGRVIDASVSAQILLGKDGSSVGVEGVLRNITVRKQAEEELKNSEERLKLLFECAPDAYYLSNLKGKFIDGNKATEELTGYKKEELIGKNFLKIRLLHPNQVPKAAVLLARNALGKATGPDEFTLNHKDGNQVTVEIRTYPIKIKGKTLILGIARDISERKQAAEALKKSEEKYSTLVEKGNDGIVIIQDGLFKFANSKLIELIGLDIKKIIEKPFIDFVSPNYRELVLERYKKRLAKEAVSSKYEIETLSKNGKNIPIEINASVIEYEGKPATMGIIRDITARKQAEARQKLAIRVLELLNKSDKKIDLIRSILLLIKEFTQFEAFGIRLKQGDDYPYYETIGFPANFVDAERFLCERNETGELIKDEKGKPILECMCGNVIRGRTNPSLPFFTKDGSFWTNSTTERLASTTKEDHQARMRNRCNREGYETMALIPLRSNREIVGLLQLNDKRKEMLTPEIIKFFEGIGASIGVALERRHQKEKLQESEGKFKNLAEKSPNMIFINKKNRVVYANKKCEEISGYKRNEFYSPDFDILTLMAPESRDLIKSNLKRHMEGGEVPPYEYALITKEGKKVHVIITTKLISYEGDSAILGIITDITDRKQTEEHIKQLQEYLQLQINRMPIGLITWDPEFRVQTWNPSAEKIFGFTEEETLGKHPYDLIVPKEAQPLVDNIWRRLLKGDKTAHSTNENATKDGRAIICDWSNTPLKKDDGTVMGVLSMVQDITERKKTEEQIKASLKEKEVLLQEVHHRVKNNMQIISSLLNLQSRQIRDEQVLKTFKSSQNRVRSMALIHERLYSSKDFAKVDFSEYVKSLTSHLFSSYGVSQNTIKLSLKIKDIYLDLNTAIPCGLIINELISNSLKHAFLNGKKGEIKIIMNPLNEDKIELIVSDNGAGIPKNVDIKKTESLGLHLVNILAEGQLHGEVKLDREKGTNFNIRFGAKK